MNDLVKTLRSELATLERELQDDARYVKVQRIKELLAAYSGNIPTPTLKQRRRSPRKAIRGDHGRFAPKLKPSTETALSKAQSVRKEIVALLTTKGQVHRKEILAHVVSKGFMGKEKNPMASLAAYLSGWRDQFETDGKGNFKLRPGRH